jgi:hypothetical protein
MIVEIRTYRIAKGQRNRFLHFFETPAGFINELGGSEDA